jgi:hypothetical protein
MKRGKFRVELFCFYPMLAIILYAAFFRVLDSKVGAISNLETLSARSRLPYQVSLGRGIRGRAQPQVNGACHRRFDREAALRTNV